MHFLPVPQSRLIWLSFFAIYVLLSAATHVTAESSEYLTDLWTSDDNLPDSSVTAIAQTPDGYLWIGTYNGLARFDGARFVDFDPANTPALKHARILGLFTDQDGTLWINTYDGSLTSFRNGTFTHEWQVGQVINIFSTTNHIYFPTISSGTAVYTPSATASNQWQTIGIDHHPTARSYGLDATGILWCLLRDGSIRRVNDTNIIALPDDSGLDGEHVNCLTADQSGRIWAGTNKRILAWNGTRFEDETPTNGEVPINISFLFCTSSNGLWAFAGDSIRHVSNRQWTRSIDSWNDLLQASPYYVSSYEDRDGNVWFRQFGQGLFCVKSDGTLDRICSTNGLPDNRVSCWFQDREGNLWIGVDRGGLVRLRQRQFQTIAGDGLKNVAVATVCEDAQSNIWIGTFDNGLDRWNNGGLEHFDLPPGTSRNAIFSVCPAAKGRLWLSADREDLFFLETNHITRGDSSLHGIKVMITDARGQTWLGRQNQLTRLTDDKYRNFGVKDGFERRDVRSLAEDRQGNIWAGTGNGVLYKFADDKFTAFKPDNESENQAIWALLPDDDGSIWAGTFRGGLLRFKNGTFTRYTTADGLPDDVICQILDDGQGKLWIGSHKGIFSIPRAAFTAYDRGNIASLPCVTYGLYDGLPTLECSGNYQPSAWRDHTGKLWFATVKGLVAVTPGKIQPNLQPPPVVLESFSVDGKSFPVSAPVHIPPGRHQFDFQFTALSFTAPDKVRFRYRLNGFDNAWVEGGNKRVAHYGPLPPGDYRFQAIACNNDGIWNESGATLALQQLPFFWQTWWFDCLAIGVTVALLSAAVRHAATRSLRQNLERLKQQQAIDRERERIAKDIHDDLGAGLTQIMLQSSLARREHPERIQTDLTQISETARDLIRAMDETVWAIDPENDTLDGLVTYVGKYVNDFLTAAKLQCRLDLPADLPTVVVPAETRHNVYLAIKETLNNVAKHSRATEVSFQLKLNADSFTFIIKDNGVGFTQGASLNGQADPDRLSSGHGLPNLARRLEENGGRCSIFSEAGQGTRVELTVFLKNHHQPQPD